MYITCPSTENLIYDDIIRFNPSDESECAESSKYVPWNPSPEKHPCKTIQEVAVPGNFPSRDFRILLTEESAE